MTAKYIDVGFFGLGLSEAEAAERFPQFTQALIEAGISEPVLKWSEELERIELNFRYEKVTDELLDQETDGLIWDILKSIYPEPFEIDPSEILEDEVLGTFYWSDEYQNWETEFLIDEDTELTLTLEPSEQEIQPLRQRLRNFVQDIITVDSEIRAVAAHELLDLYNRHWNEGEEIGLEQFVGRMALTDVCVNPTGILCTYDIRELFGDHGIEIELDTDGKYVESRLQG